MGWEQILGWLADRLLAPIVVGVLGVLLTYRLRRSVEIRDAHLSELKKEALQPMLAYLDEYVLPILRREAGNIDICFRLVPNPSGVLERPVMEHLLCVRPVKEPLQVYTFGMGAVSAILDPPASRLVGDARSHHFPQLLRRWDTVVARFHEYGNACLRYVEMLRAEIVRENSLLPEFDPQSSDSEWVNAAALGVIIFLRHLGLPIRELDFKVEGDRRVWSYNTLAVARGTIGQLLPLQAHVERLVNKRDGMQQLIEIANSLEVEVVTVRASIEDQRLKRRLPGKCSYL